MSRVTVNWKGDEWLAKAFIPAGNAAFEDIAKWGKDQVMGSMHAGTGPSAPFTPPNRHLNKLAKSIYGEGPAEHGVPFVARIGSNSIRARILEFGGTIIPRKQKALCFPINKAGEDFARKRGGGVKAYGDGESAHMRGVLLALMFKYNGPGNKARGRRRAKGSVTGGGYRFVFKRKKGKFTGVWGVVKRGQGKDAPFIETEPMFLVTKRVTIRARPFLRPLVNSPDRQQALRTFAVNAFSTRLRQFSTFKEGGIITKSGGGFSLLSDRPGGAA